MLIMHTPLAAAQEAGATDGGGNGWQLRWREHPEVMWGDLLRVSLRANLQLDSRRSQMALERDGDSFDVGRRRLAVRGRIGPRLGFQVDREFESSDPWRDVFVSFEATRTLEVRAGRFKLPFGLEETTGGSQLKFLYRSNVSRRLAPGRDPGVVVQGRLGTKRIGYEAGVFAHDGNNARPTNTTRVFGAHTVAARLVIEPFGKSHRVWRGLKVGAAMTVSPLAEGFPSLRGRSLFGTSYYDADVWVRGGRRRAGLEAQWRRGPLWFGSEYIRVSDDRHHQSADNSDLPPLVAQGWYLSGAWTVALRAGGWIRPAARVERLAFGSAAGAANSSTAPRAEIVLGNHEAAITLGLTWRPNRWTELQTNVVRENIGERATPFPHLRVLSQVVRLQLSL
jgi:phosphate-selective porin